MNCFVGSDCEELMGAIVHRPGKEIERLTASNIRRFLFDDVAFLERMQKEHDYFVEKLREAGTKIFYLEKLLEEILKDEDIRKRLVSRVTILERCEGLESEFWENLSEEELVEVLIAGLTMNEKLRRKPEEKQARDEWFVITPIPNLYFMRDPGAIICNGAVCGSMFFPERAREALLLQYVFKYHHLFKDLRIWFGARERETRPYTIEGGDIAILNSNAIIVGNSERTRTFSIEKLAANLFESRVVDKVYEIRIPPERIYMHLDTVFSIVDKDKVVVYPDALHQQEETIVYTPTQLYGEVRARPERLGSDFQGCLMEEMGDYEIIYTGGKDPTAAEREQFSDGTNTLAVAPGVVITYERNVYTNKALENAGVKVIKVPGSELVRGRGGPRCMVLPLIRGKSGG